MSLFTRTIYGTALQTAQLLQTSLDIPENSTLNKKFNVLSGELPTINEGLPSLQYYAIGRGGHRNVAGPDGASLTQLNKHRASDAAPFTQIPFVLRPVDDDLTAEERTGYALRRREVHNELEYYAYYLKRMPALTNSPEMLITTVQDGETTTLPFNPPTDSLSPTPLSLESDGVNEVSGDYLTTSSLVQLTLSVTDIEAITEACTIIYGNPAYATISEVCMVSAVPRIVSGDANGLGINYTEAVGAQANVHVSVGPYPLESVKNELGLVYELGASEMLAV